MTSYRYPIRNPCSRRALPLTRTVSPTLTLVVRGQCQVVGAGLAGAVLKVDQFLPMICGLISRPCRGERLPCHRVRPFARRSPRRSFPRRFGDPGEGAPPPWPPGRDRLPDADAGHGGCLPRRGGCETESSVPAGGGVVRSAGMTDGNDGGIDRPADRPTK